MSPATVKELWGSPEVLEMCMFKKDPRPVGSSEWAVSGYLEKRNQAPGP